jgi:hypothetical protein
MPKQRFTLKMKTKQEQLERLARMEKRKILAKSTLEWQEKNSRPELKHVKNHDNQATQKLEDWAKTVPDTFDARQFYSKILTT